MLCIMDWDARETRETTPRPRRAGQRAVFAVGEMVAGRYRILRPLGSGAMGEVFEAEDLELRQRVALKTIRPEMALDLQAAERFRREILLARSVTHPNACRIFDMGRHERAEGSIVFLTMELLLGETLSSRIRRDGPMAPEQALPIARQVAAALDAAHAAGIVHRDLKGGNVVLVPPEGGAAGGDALRPDRVVVTDFGLARRLEGKELEASLTGAMEWVGTPANAAPEQVEGARVTAAADVYAFGVVLYEMLTGQMPFEGASPQEVAVKRLTEAPIAPSRRCAVDPRWEAVILRCLERWPTDRFASCGAVVEAIEGDLSVGGIVAPARRRRRTLLLALLGAVAIVGTAGTIVVARRPVHAPAPSAAERARSEASRAAAAASRQRLGAPGLAMAAGSAAFQRVDLAEASREFERAAELLAGAGADDASRAQVRIPLAIVRRLQGRLAEARTEIEAVLAIPELSGWSRTSILMQLAEVQLASGDVAAARRALDESGNVASLVRAEVELAEGAIAAAAATAREVTLPRLGVVPERIAPRVRAFLAHVLILDGRVDEARAALATAEAELASGDPLVERVAVAVAGVRVATAAGDAAERTARVATLAALAEAAASRGFVLDALEARLALAESEKAAGDPAGTELLKQLEIEAAAGGFGLVARRAADSASR